MVRENYHQSPHFSIAHSMSLLPSASIAGEQDVLLSVIQLYQEIWEFGNIFAPFSRDATQFMSEILSVSASFYIVSFFLLLFSLLPSQL